MLFTLTPTLLVFLLYFLVLFLSLFIPFIDLVNKYLLSTDSIPVTVSKSWRYANNKIGLRPYSHGVYNQVLVAACALNVGAPQDSTSGCLPSYTFTWMIIASMASFTSHLIQMLPLKCL